jgi:peptidase E
MRKPTIVAMGGGGFSMEPDEPRLDAFVLSLTGKARPRVCFLPTASGDRDEYVARFHAAFSLHHACEHTHLKLFPRTEEDLRAFVLSQDVVYVGGGSTANMLATWRVHGLDRVLREAWEAGVVLTGVSAGALCWFEAGVTDSFGPALAPLRDGLGFLGGSCCPHYDGEPQRRPTYRRLVADGTLPGGLAADDGAALWFEGRVLRGAVASREGARAWRVERTPGGFAEAEIVPTPLAAT